MHVLVLALLVASVASELTLIPATSKFLTTFEDACVILTPSSSGWAFEIDDGTADGVALTDCDDSGTCGCKRPKTCRGNSCTQAYECADGSGDDLCYDITTCEPSNPSAEVEIFVEESCPLDRNKPFDQLSHGQITWLRTTVNQALEDCIPRCQIFANRNSDLVPNSANSVLVKLGTREVIGDLKACLDEGKLSQVRNCDITKIEDQQSGDLNVRQLFELYVNTSGGYTTDDLNTFRDLFSQVPEVVRNRMQAGIPNDRNPIKQCGSDPTASFDLGSSSAFDLWKEWESNPVEGNKGRIAVVGAGVAGLMASWVLPLLGYDVDLYESSDRVGGRLLSAYLGNDQYGDLGAMRFGDSDYLLNYLADKAGVNQVPFTNSEAPAYFYYNGVLADINSVKRSDLNAMGLNNVREEYVSSFKNVIGAVLKPYVDLIDAFDGSMLPFAVYAAVGDMTEYAMLTEHGLTQDEIEYGTIAGNTACYARRTSGTDFMVDSGSFANPDPSASEYITMDGGMSNFVRGVLAAMPDNVNVLLNQRVAKIKADPKECSSNRPMQVCTDAAGDNCKRYDGVIMTVPTPMMSHMDFEPPLPPSTQRSLRFIEYDESTKVVVAFSESPWDEAEFPWGTQVMTDLVSRQLLFLNNSVVMAYTWARDAEALYHINEKERVDLVIRDIAQATNTPLADVRRAYTGASASKSWKTDPNIGGAFTLYGAGNFMDVQCGIANDIDESAGYHKRLRTTGEHKDAFGHGWMETSFVSAVEQVSELTALLDQACKR